MQNQHIYNKYKNQIDKCIRDVDENIFKLLGIKSEGVDLIVNGSKNEPKSIHIIHYVSEHDINTLGDMNMSGELDNYLDGLNRGFKFNMNADRDFEGVYPDGPCVDGYTDPNGILYNDYGRPAIQFYWGWLPKQLAN